MDVVHAISCGCFQAGDDDGGAVSGMMKKKADAVRKQRAARSYPLATGCYGVAVVRWNIMVEGNAPGVKDTAEHKLLLAVTVEVVPQP